VPHAALCAVLHVAFGVHAHTAAHLTGLGDDRGCPEAEAERGGDADCDFV
jgi:hypothetical protein